MGFFIIVAFGALLALFIYGRNGSLNKRKMAKAEYERCLSNLSEDPTNPILRKRTLELGRTYSSLTRGDNGISLFDEVALMNDINAACGGTTALVPANNLPAQSVRENLSLQDRLARLEQLKEQALVSNDEYQEKRQQLLAEI